MNKKYDKPKMEKEINKETQKNIQEREKFNVLVKN